jgi:choline dehydrogenase-like flavoprotein
VRVVHSLDFLLAAEGLPHPDNCVTVRRDGKTVVQYRPTNLVALQKLAAQVRHMLDTIGAPCIRAPLSLHAGAEAMLRGSAGSGTVRMGPDPARSAVDPQGRAHQLDNLWVSDASIFPSGSALEPTLTLVALALRTADQVTGAQLQAAAVAGGWAA